MNNTYKKIFTIILFIVFILVNHVFSQPGQIKNSAELQLALQKLDVLGSVLYIGAHPDDENTNLMAYWSKGKNYNWLTLPQIRRIALSKLPQMWCFTMVNRSLYALRCDYGITLNQLSGFLVNERTE